MSGWMRDVDAQELPSTEGFSFTGFLAKPTDVRAWNIQVRQGLGPSLLLPLVYGRLPIIYSWREWVRLRTELWTNPPPPPVR